MLNSRLWSSKPATERWRSGPGIAPYASCRFLKPNSPTTLGPARRSDTLQDWIDTGQFSMSVIRNASLNAHAAARQISEDTAAKSAARAAGQAVATAHVRTHSPGAAKYAQQALFRAALPEDAKHSVTQERDWQFNRLKQLIKERQP